MNRTKAPLAVVALALLVSVACTSTERQASVQPSIGGSPIEAPTYQSEAAGRIVFNRGTWPDIAVYSLDLGTGTEHKIRDVEDFVTMSPDGRRFVDIAWKVDGSTTPATFGIDGSGYTVLKFADPTFAMAVGSGGWSPDGKRFFGGGGVATDHSRDGLYTVRVADGGGLVRLTQSRHDYAVGYSPDGSHALFISEVKPYDHSGPMDVFVIGTHGEGLVRLNPPGTTSGLDGQSWSPDGREVAFVAAKGSFWDDDRAVFVADADGTDARRITPWNETYRAEWSPDGEWIAYDFDPSGSGADPHDLYVVHPDGAGRKRVTSNEDGKMSFAPVWSPDSRSLLFVRRELEDDPDLWTVNVDGTGLFQVTHSPAEYTGYRWLPPNPYRTASNGDIVFVSDEVVDFSDRLSDFAILYRVDPGGGESRKIVDIGCPFLPGKSCVEAVGIGSVDWSPDGSRMAYSLFGYGPASLGEREGIYVINAETEQVHQLTSCTDPCARQDDVDWSPDGSRIAYRQADHSFCDWMNSFDGSCSIYTMKPDGTDRVKLPTGSVVDPVDPSWSPDGTSIAFSARVGEDWFVYTMALDGSEPTRLAADLVPSPEETQPAWSPDGSTIAFVTWEGASDGSEPTGLDVEHGLPFALWSMAPDGSHRRLLTTSCCFIGGAGFGVQGPEWSPDGTQILLTSGTGGGLVRIDAETGELFEIPGKKGPWSAPAPTGPIAWQPVP